jgi:DNA-binding MarR family transcriptional regulator
VSRDQPPGQDEVPIPALLRAARGAYGHAIRRALSERGIDDMPPNGPYVIGGMGNRDQPLGSLVQQLRVSKQAAGQLIDSLVQRGYLSRSPDADDRRRVNIALTERGREAADAVRTAVMAVDRELTGLLGSSGLEQLRAGLAALADIREHQRAAAPPTTGPS